MPHLCQCYLLKWEKKITEAVIKHRLCVTTREWAWWFQRSLLYHHLIISTAWNSSVERVTVLSPRRNCNPFVSGSTPVTFVHASGGPIFNRQGNESPHLTSAGKGWEMGLQNHSRQGWTLKSQLIRGRGRKQPGPLHLGPHGHVHEDHSHTRDLPSFIKQSETLLEQRLYSSKLTEKWKLWPTEGSSCRMLRNCPLRFLRHSSQSVRASAQLPFERPMYQYLVREHPSLDTLLFPNTSTLATCAAFNLFRFTCWCLSFNAESICFLTSSAMRKGSTTRISRQKSWWVIYFGWIRRNLELNCLKCRILGRTTSWESLAQSSPNLHHIPDSIL